MNDPLTSPEALENYQLIEERGFFRPGKQSAAICAALARDLQKALAELDALRTQLAKKQRFLRSAQEAALSACATAEIFQKQRDDARAEVSRCSHHHTQAWELPAWAKSSEALSEASVTQLEDLMGMCHQEDGDPAGTCLACFAYVEIQRRE